MKTVTYIAIILGAMIAAAVELPIQPPEAKITARVSGEDGKRIAGATVKVIFDHVIPGKEIQPLVLAGATDVNGEYSASGPTAGQKVGGTVEKVAFYKSSFSSPLLEKSVARHWQPWNPVIDVFLKPIGDPIPMYAKKVDTDLPLNEQVVWIRLAGRRLGCTAWKRQGR